MRSRPYRSLFALLAVVFLATQSPIFAEDDQAVDLKSWEKLTQRKKDIVARSQVLIKEFQKADLARKEEIKQEYEKLGEEDRALSKKLVALAPEVIKKDPGNMDAVNLLLIEYFQTNRYQQAADVADAALKAEQSDALILNIGGVSHFAINNYKRAKELLTKAQEENQLIRDLGGRYLAECDEYQKLWEAEQKIRAAEKKADDLPRVEFDTDKGRIVIELFENEAPNAVANFISLIEKGYYDGIAFHRIIPNFMTQGGDPNTLDDNPGNDGQGGPGYTIDCECYVPEARQHFQGSLSMAHAGRNTGGSQFFLTHLPTAHLNGKHTVFGRIIEGIDVNAGMEQGDKIKSAKVLRKREHPYKPKTNPDK
ncbi:peptidylprolyl isomerase [Symmachiella dynata]|uniref:peptidylprolyl isomerase n=1 Tax=Symmachiella dynata TaxID=2527995 RepID=A0A517ZNJ3_9PLAN|nr:peptidylprolyl isomerase [Symmachiella dynata]QDU44046.1 putative peptidyl-prolyl cis-trans isomerase [Symmachiella dynata]